MVDLNSLRGFIPKLAELPTILYCHENQFDYPRNAQPQEEANRLNAQLSAIYSMRCADKVLFNSNYNLSTFFKGARRLFNKLPDGVSIADIEPIELKSAVLPVPIKIVNSSSPINEKQSKLRTQADEGYPLSIVWNHRWEFDKQPEVLFEAVKILQAQKLNFRLQVLGQSFRKVPACFANARLNFADYIDNWGFQSRAKYDQILLEADIVVSTALHDFQGLSMLEAINLNCVPVAPNRVAYPEYIDQELLYSLDEFESEGQALAAKLQWLIENWQTVSNDETLKFRKLASRYLSEQLIPSYQEIIESACGDS